MDDADITVTYYDLGMITEGDSFAEDMTPNVDSGVTFVDTGVASTRVAPSVSAAAVKTVD